MYAYRTAAGRGDRDDLTALRLVASVSTEGAPDVDGLVLELDSSYSDSPIGSPGQADQSQELTYVDIDTFLASF